MKPTDKSPEITSLLESLYGRTSAVQNNVCIPEPIGCAKPIKGFRNEISRKEYQISGLCQECQDKIFGEN